VTCRNCGAGFLPPGEFCAACGQRAIDPDPTLRELVHELAEQFLQWDGRLGTTFRLLVTQPGALTTEYIAGRRVRYLSPLRLYLTCSVLFFFLAALVPESPTIETRGGSVQAQARSTRVTENDSTEISAALDTLATRARWMGDVWSAHVHEAIRRRGEVSSAVTAYIPRMMFVLVPVFAALIGLVYRSRARRYPQHLAFALHAHAFLYLALVVMLAGRLTTSDAVRTSLELLLMALIAIYFTRALRHVYGGSPQSAILRAGAVSLSYFVTFVSAMVLTVGLIVLIRF
jgi:hypothetical protein